jgi:hypothetical protein
MSWGDSLVGGFSAMRSTMDRKSQREQDERMSKADRDVRQKMLQDQIDSDMTKMRMGIDRDYTINKSNHTWQTGEREATQGWQGGQADLNRGMTQQEIDNKLSNDVQAIALRRKELAQQAPLTAAHANYFNSGGGTGHKPATTWEQTLDDSGNPTSTVMKGQGAPPPFGKTTTSSAPPPPATPSGPGFFGRLADGFAKNGADAWMTASAPLMMGAAAVKRMVGSSDTPSQATQAEKPAGTSGQYAEGQILVGPDGKTHKVINGVPQPIE